MNINFIMASIGVFLVIILFARGHLAHCQALSHSFWKRYADIEWQGENFCVSRIKPSCQHCLKTESIFLQRVVVRDLADSANARSLKAAVISSILKEPFHA